MNLRAKVPWVLGIAAFVAWGAWYGRENNRTVLRPRAALWNLRAVGRHEDPYGLAQKRPVFPGIRYLEL